MALAATRHLEKHAIFGDKNALLRTAPESIVDENEHLLFRDAATVSIDRVRQFVLRDIGLEKIALDVICVTPQSARYCAKSIDPLLLKSGIASIVPVATFHSASAYTSITDDRSRLIRHR
ncbi:hypothetical protein [Candidatus Burkholderia verschuerenii]|uniref:hypothetical protein n=1 Tax=Candidatus Burkholderia verschuerenii TaxID=242163 RepID=UPI00067A9C09|nr:hypothetical protein [Candidatus Burkholderia verschuerenii]